jgi:hypothetical protein
MLEVSSVQARLACVRTGMLAFKAILIIQQGMKIAQLHDIA